MNDFSPNQQEGLWWMNDTTPKPPKGVVGAPLPNGSWGSHWLGTLGTQEVVAHPHYRVAADTSQESIQQETEEIDQGEEMQMEHMFEKPLTPSDVGKLNRLVIPKQHAEKYFPLSRVESAEKGLLLSFEDETGKLWRFRYSYWNSSQSYVLTKGWSRFVKEKKLDAGDVVSFERRRPDGEQLYIRWRRRVAHPVQDSRLSQSVTAPSSTTTSPAWTRVYYSAHPYPSHHLHGPLLYQPDCLHAAGVAVEPVIEKPVPRGNKRQVRLFGVNLDCQLDEQPDEPPGPDVSSFPSQGPAHFLYSQGHDLNHHIQQDFNFSREYYQTRNYPGGSGGMQI